MKIYSEKSLRNFDFWSGAICRAEMLTCEELDAVENELEAINPDGMSDTEINDLFWFNFGYICELIGLDYDESNYRVRRGDDDEEDEEEEE